MTAITKMLLLRVKIPPMFGKSNININSNSLRGRYVLYDASTFNYSLILSHRVSTKNCQEKGVLKKKEELKKR